MRLDVRVALTGEPTEGAMVDVMLADGRTLILAYEPHGTFDRYVWRVWLDAPLDEADKLFVQLEERDIEADWVACYLSCDREIVIGQPLSLVLVPQGNMHDWPREMTQSVVASLVIR